ncbi:MAG: ankyrin repeat domain-containing protein [Gemmataceae bacterium]
MLTRRAMTAAVGGSLLAGTTVLAADPPPAGPTEAPFTRDYPAPKFKPNWKKPQINRQLAQDFVIYAHSDLAMTKKLLEKEPGLLNAAIDWGNGDWETALGGASHMGERETVLYLLEKGARVDLFAATMLGLLDVVKTLLTLQPKLIDAKGPHGFSLHFHAQVGGTHSANVLDYLQSVKKLELKPVPFLKKK